MGTQAEIYIVADSYNVATIHVQHDGYPEDNGLGKTLSEFLAGRTLVSGWHAGEESVANGMQDLAAQLVCHLKSESPVGGVYLAPTAPGRHEDLEEIWDFAISNTTWTHYIYMIHEYAGKIYITVKDAISGEEFIGDVAAFAEMRNSLGQ